MCADESDIAKDEAKPDEDQQLDRDFPITSSTDSSAGVTVHIEHIETTPITDEQYQIAVTALAELINQWQCAQRHRSHGAA